MVETHDLSSIQQQISELTTLVKQATDGTKPPKWWEEQDNRISKLESRMTTNQGCVEQILRILTGRTEEQEQTSSENEQVNIPNLPKTDGKKPMLVTGMNESQFSYKHNEPEILKSKPAHGDSINEFTASDIRILHNRGYKLFEKMSKLTFQHWTDHDSNDKLFRQVFTGGVDEFIKCEFNVEGLNLYMDSTKNWNRLEFAQLQNQMKVQEELSNKTVTYYDTSWRNEGILTWKYASMNSVDFPYTEGKVEFRSVLYIPGMGPLNNEDVTNYKTKNIHLYVKRVFISDEFDGELFPRYLSFVKGVVDSNDLPLSVSRETLQESRIVRIMRKRLVGKTFDMIQEISERENKEDYKKFWENFGRFLKLGCIEDTGNHKRITPLLRFYTSKSEEELTSLDTYVENMSENQKAIYYLATDSLKSAKTAPFLEKLVQKDIEVLYLIEPIDEVAIQNLQTFKEKKFVDISKEDLELGDEDEVKERETKQEYNLLCDWVKQQLGDKVAKVQISKRLSSSPCVLVSGKFGWSANMERLMKAQALGDTASLEFMRGRRILEINPDHPIIKDLNAACKNAPESSDAKRAADLLYDTALISSGFSPDSPAEFGNKIYEMMAMALGGRWGRSDEIEASEASAGETNTGTDDSSETQVIEPSEVRTESDPWED